MENRNQWVKTKVRTGWMLLAIGLVVIVGGIVAERQFAGSPYNLRILTGVGYRLCRVGHRQPGTLCGACCATGRTPGGSKPRSWMSATPSSVCAPETGPTWHRLG